MSDFSSKALRSNSFITLAVLLTPTSSRAAHDSFFQVSHSLLNEPENNTHSQAAAVNPKRAFPDLPARLQRGAG